MKKILLVSLLIVTIMFCSALQVKALTEAEKQVLIAQILQQIAALQAQLDQMIAAGITDTGTTGAGTTGTTPAWCYSFNSVLKYGDSGSDVAALQHALELQSLFSVNDPETVGSFFGTNTVSAVINFQEKYKSEILTPQGISKGTGTVASGTNKKLNQLYGCSAVVTVPTNTSCSPNWQCPSWGACVNNQQIRSCIDYNSCGVTAGKPSEVQYCSATCSPNWQCDSWGTCYGTSQVRTCTDLNNCGITSGKPNETQACTSTSSNPNNNPSTACNPVWTYSSWSTCSNYQQTRTATQTNCSLVPPSRTESQYCNSSTTSACNPVWTYSSWSTCSNYQQTRTATQTNCSLVPPSRTESQYCNSSTAPTSPTTPSYNCYANWQCTDWLPCYNSSQSRTCNDYNYCNTTVGKPSEIQSCTVSCTPNWQCTNWGSCSNSSQIRTCTDYNYCNTTTGKPAEVQSCTSGTPTNCTENWQCGSWGTCSNSSQSRTCTDYNYCGTTLQKPPVTQSCTSGTTNPPVTCTPSWQIGDWSDCIGNYQTRTVTDRNNCGITANMPINSQSCVPACTPNWQIGNWSACSGSSQNRDVTDSNNCGITTNKPISYQTCKMPTVTLSANGSDRAYAYIGDPVTVKWAATNASYCSGDLSFNGTSGTTTVSAGSKSTTYYKITCSDNYGTTAEASISVTGYDKPYLSIGTGVTGVYSYGNIGNSTSTVDQGTAMTLYWSGSNSLTGCTGSGDWADTQISSYGSKNLGALTQVKTYTYTISCIDTIGGQAPISATATVTVLGASIDFKASDHSTITPSNSITIPSGTSIYLSWAVLRVHSCSTSGNWNYTYNFPSSGDYGDYSLTSSRIYNLSCVDNYSGNVITKTVNVTVTTPSVDIKVTKPGGQNQAVDGPITLTSGSAATLTWTSANDNSCIASGDWSGVRNLNNSTGESTGFLYTAKTYTYTLTCKDSLNNSKSDSVSITVGSGTPPATPTVDIKANGSDGPLSLSGNNSATITWTSNTGANLCTASGDWSGSKDASGQQTVGPFYANVTKTYTISCSGTGGTATDSVAINAFMVY